MRELAELRAGLEDALGGRGRMFLVSGEPGVGKTRLADELASDAASQGMRVVWGRCWEGGGAPAYLPWVDVLRSLIIHEPRERERHSALPAEIAQLIPELSSESAAPRAPSDPSNARFRLFDAVATLLKQVARSAPLLVILDDLQDADQSSLELLKFVARGLTDSPIVIVGTHRDAEVRRSPHLSEAIGEGLRYGHAIPLAGLDQDEVARIVEHRAQRSPSAAFTSELHRVTAGNPLFVDGVLRVLLAERNLGISDRIELRGFKLPEDVRGAIRKRLGLVSAQAQSLLAIAAVIGQEFDPSLLQRVSNVRAEGLSELLNDASEMGLVARSSHDSYRFTHSLIRESLCDDLAANRRIELHGDIGVAIEEIYGGDLKSHLAELARHFTEAGIEAKAIDFWIKAGDAAYSVFGFEEAASCWRTALAMTENQRTDSLVRARLLERLGDSTTVGDFYPAKCAEHLEAALRIYQNLGDRERAARVHTRLGHRMSANLAGMDIPGALAHYQNAEAVLNNLPERASLGSLYIGFGAAAREAMQTKEGLRTSRRGMQIAERLGAETLWIAAATVHSDLLLNAGRIGGALALSDEAYAKADTLNDPGPASDAATLACANYSQLWDPCQAESYISGELGKARLAQAPHLQEGLRIWMDIAHLQKGEFKRRNRLGTTNQWDAFVQGKEKIYSGEWELARSIAARSLAYCRRIGSRDATARSMLYAAKVCRLKGLLEEGVAQLREILSMCADDLNSLCEVEVLPELALILVEAARVGDAELYLKRWREIMSAGEDWLGLAGAGARAEAVVAAATGRYQDAEAQFEKAIEIFRRYQVPFEEADALYYWGRALNASGEHGRASEKLDAAIEIYRRCGAGERWIDRVETARKSGGADTSKESRPATSSDAAFRQEGEFWTLAYKSENFRLKDSKGLQYIAHLIRNEGREVRSDEVASVGAGADSDHLRHRAPRDVVRVASDLGDTGVILDARAKAEYRARMADLKAELAEAEGNNDLGRAESARGELEAIENQLTSALGLGGRDRKSHAHSERARWMVTNSIKRAIAKIDQINPPLGRHLHTCVRTGNFCSYTPDPEHPVAWQL